MTVGLLFFALQSSFPPMTPITDLSVIDNPNPTVDVQLFGQREWMRVPPALQPNGSATRTLAGDWNGDHRLDAVVLIDGQLFVVVAPGEARGGVLIPTLGSIADFDFLQGGGPDGQDALIAVGSAGLTMHYFHNILESFIEVSLESSDWLFARSVRVLERPQLAADIYIGVGATPTDIIGYLPAQDFSTALLSHSAPIERLEVLDWAGDSEEEFVVMSSGEATVYDVRAVQFAQFTAPGESSVALEIFQRALEPYDRIAWATTEGGTASFTLRLYADGIVEPPLDLGSLQLASLAAGELNGDGSDELFLSHRTSEHQVILLSQALVGDLFSASFDATEFVILTALPALSELLDEFPIGKPSSSGGGTNGFGGSPGLFNPVPTAGVPGGLTGPGGGVSGGSSGVPVEGGRRDSSNQVTPPATGLINPFLRNNATPAFGDFDNDGDLDLLFPVSNSGDLVFQRNGLVDHRRQLTRVASSQLNSAGPDAYRLDISITEPPVVSPYATHVELAVWRSAGLGDSTDHELHSYKTFDLGEGWPMPVSFVMDEPILPFHDLYHLQLRLVERTEDIEVILLRAFPVMTATFASSKPVFETLFAAAKIRGGGVTTPKTGPVFVGGIAPRPNLDPFAPGAMPLAPGGGQVQ